MDYNALEKLIADVAANPEVTALSAEIEAILQGKDSKAKLLAFLPIIAKIIYSIVDKEGKDIVYFQIGEELLELLVKTVEKTNQEFK